MKKYLRIILGIWGALCFIIFLIPMLTGIFNIGGFTGIIISAGMLLASIFWDTLAGFYAANRNKIFIKVLKIFFTGLFSVISLCTILLTSGMIYSANKHISPNTEMTVIVLGCKVNGNVPSLMLRSRLETAARFLNENSDAKCIVSGGKGNIENISEAEAMKNFLLDKGITNDRIICEDKSKDTTENIEFSSKIIKERSLPENIVIVTNEFHEMRAILNAGKSGLRSYAESAKTPVYLFPTYYVRELYALLEYIIFK